MSETIKIALVEKIKQALKIGITGGIGSGKSVVCRMFGLLGVPVYYSDMRAKELMTQDIALVEEIKRAFGADSYRDGELNKAYIADKVFKNKELLVRLDSLVHPVVMRDFDAWAAVMGEGNKKCIELRGANPASEEGKTMLSDKADSAASFDTNAAGKRPTEYVVMESAIIFEAGLADMFDRVVTVSAPQELRIERAMMRSNISRGDVLERIANQMSDSHRELQADFTIHNDETSLVWEQVIEIDLAIRQLDKLRIEN